MRRAHVITSLAVVALCSEEATEALISLISDTNDIAYGAGSKVAIIDALTPKKVNPIVYAAFCALHEIFNLSYETEVSEEDAFQAFHELISKLVSSDYAKDHGYSSLRTFRDFLSILDDLPD